MMASRNITLMALLAQGAFELAERAVVPRGVRR